MIIGNPIMLGGGRGGGLDPSKPLIHVNAPIGSTVDIILSSLIIATIPPAKAFANADGETAEYYYSCPSTGTYTVTGTLGTQTASATVVCSTNEQYNATLQYILRLVKDGLIVRTGDAFTAVGMKGNSSSSATPLAPNVSTGTGYIEIGYSTVYPSARAGIAYLGVLDATPYSKVTFVGQSRNNSGATGNGKANGWSAFGTYQTDNRYFAVDTQTSASSTSYVSMNIEVDISAITGDLYVGFNVAANNNGWVSIRVTDIYLEP